MTIFHLGLYVHLLNLISCLGLEIIASGVVLANFFLSGIGIAIAFAEEGDNTPDIITNAIIVYLLAVGICFLGGAVINGKIVQKIL